jgi:hypothetical protein
MWLQEAALEAEIAAEERDANGAPSDEELRHRAAYRAAKQAQDKADFDRILKFWQGKEGK